MRSEPSAWFGQLREELKHRTGVVIEADREYAASVRLTPVMREQGFVTVAQLCRAAFSERNMRAQNAVIDAMMNNETFFFRDRGPFDDFREFVLPSLLESRAASRSIRIWCAACATGQEPYSLAMALDEEARRLAGWRIEILATDISETALQTARAGIYNQFEVQRGLPVSYLLRYFRREGDRWSIAEHLRSRITFQKLNLQTDFSDIGQFEVIFCRNVMIYFDTAAKRDLLARLSERLSADGYLALGAAETTIGVTRDLVSAPQRPWLSRRKDLSAPVRLRIVS